MGRPIQQQAFQGFIMSTLTQDKSNMQYSVNSVSLSGARKRAKISSLIVRLQYLENVADLTTYDLQFDCILSAFLINRSNFNLLIPNPGPIAPAVLQFVSGGVYLDTPYTATPGSMDIPSGGVMPDPPGGAGGIIVQPLDFNDGDIPYAAMNAGDSDESTDSMRKNNFFVYTANAAPFDAEPRRFAERSGLPIFSISLGDALTIPVPDFSRMEYVFDVLDKEVIMFTLSPVLLRDPTGAGNPKVRYLSTFQFNLDYI